MFPSLRGLSYDYHGHKPQDRLSDLLLLDRPRMNNLPDLLRRKALRTATIYCAHNMWRFRQEATHSHIRESLAQHLRGSVRDYEGAAKALDRIFAPQPS